MKNHIKVYLKGMHITALERFEDMFIPCEWCGTTAVDVHHIFGRGAGGSKLKDDIENLAALCRDCHLAAEAHRIDREELRALHLQKISI